ncbi:MAG: hypothetical protein ACXVUE_18185 [Solirubrobacteraceae bacterium]
MSNGRRPPRWPLVTAAAMGAVGELVRRRRSARKTAAPSPTQPSEMSEPPPPLTTQSSPGQIADLQEAYGADMAPPELPDTERPSD